MSANLSEDCRETTLGNVSVDGGGGGNCSAAAVPFQAPVMVVYSSQTERVVSLLAFVLVLVVACTGQLSVIVTVLRSASLHTQHFVIIVTYCVGDLGVLITQSAMYIWCFVAGDVPLLLCRVLSCTQYILVFGMASHIGYMAFERYVYFCNAMRYEAMFSKRNMALAIGAIYSVALSYIIMTEITIGREYHSAVMACNLTESSSGHSIFQILVFSLPTVLITIFCSIKIWRQAVKSSVVPTAPHQAPSQQEQSAAGAGAGAGAAGVHKDGSNAKQQAGRALRVILLVSGVFWATSLPASITRGIYFNVGITWEDLDTRRSYEQSIFLRINYYLFSLFSPIVNPIIYYYSRKDLRVALRKVLGISGAVAPVDY